MKGNTTFTVEEAKSKLEHYCTYQERCHKEVQEKLEKMRMIPEAIDIVMVHLIENNYLNEERFANAYVRGKFKIKKWGRYRLTHNLKLKGIHKSVVTKAIATISEEDYILTFNELAERKLQSITEKNPQKKKKKLADYLLYRGWESGLVYEKVNELVK